MGVAGKIAKAAINLARGGVAKSTEEVVLTGLSGKEALSFRNLLKERGHPFSTVQPIEHPQLHKGFERQAFASSYYTEGSASLFPPETDKVVRSASKAGSLGSMKGSNLRAAEYYANPSSGGRPGRFPSGSAQRDIEQGMFDEEAAIKAGKVLPLELSGSKPIEPYNAGRFAAKVSEEPALIHQAERFAPPGGSLADERLGNAIGVFMRTPELVQEGLINEEALYPFMRRTGSRIFVSVFNAPEPMRRTLLHEIGHAVFRPRQAVVGYSDKNIIPFLENMLGRDGFSKLIANELLPNVLFFTKRSEIEMVAKEAPRGWLNPVVDRFVRATTKPQELVADAHLVSFSYPKFARKYLPGWTEVVEAVYNSPQAAANGIKWSPAIFLPFMLSGAALSATAPNEVSDILEQTGPTEYGI